MPNKHPNERKSIPNAVSNRRQFLAQITGTSLGFTAIAAGLPNAVAAESATSISRQDFVEAAEPFQSLPKVKAAVRQYATPLLTELADQGLIGKPSVSALNLSEIVSADGIDDTDGWVVVSALLEDDTPTARIYLRRKTDDVKFSISVLPQADRSYAIIDSGEESTPEIIEYTADGSVNSTSACIIGESCGPVGVTPVGYDCRVLRLYCCNDGSCYWDYVIQPCAVGQTCRVNCCAPCNTC